MSSSRVPQLFQVVPRSSEGHEMRSQSSPAALENLIIRFPVIRIGLAGTVSVVEEIEPPPVWVDHDGTVHIETDGWHTVPAPNGPRGGTGSPLLRSRASVADRLAVHTRTGAVCGSPCRRTRFVGPAVPRRLRDHVERTRMTTSRVLMLAPTNTL